VIWLLQSLWGVGVGTGKVREWLVFQYLPAYLEPLSFPVYMCIGDSCVKPVNSRCELQGAHHGFTLAEFGFLISPDCQIPVQTDVIGTIPNERFRLAERIAGCLFSNKHLPKSAKTKKKLSLVLAIITHGFLKQRDFIVPKSEEPLSPPLCNRQD